MLEWAQQIVQWSLKKDKYLRNLFKEPEQSNGSVPSSTCKRCISMFMCAQLGDLTAPAFVAEPSDGNPPLPLPLSPTRQTYIRSVHTCARWMHFYCLVVLDASHKDRTRRPGEKKKFEAVKASLWIRIAWEVTTDGDYATSSLNMTPGRHCEHEQHILPRLGPEWGHGILLKTRLHIEFLT